MNSSSSPFLGLWNEDPSSSTAFGYDFWYQPRHNVMVSSEWGAPSAFGTGFSVDHVAAGSPANDPLLARSNPIYDVSSPLLTGLYGHCLHVWDWKRRQRIATLDLGAGEGMMPLETRFLHDPDRKEGFVGCALSSNVFR